MERDVNAYNEHRTRRASITKQVALLGVWARDALSHVLRVLRVARVACQRVLLEGASARGLEATAGDADP